MRLALLASFVLLTACVLPGAKPVKPAQNPITGAEVTTQSLDVSKPGAPKPAALPSPTAGLVDASLDAITAPKPSDEAAKTQPKPTEKPAKPKSPEEVAAEALMAATAAEPATPPEQQTPEQAKCLKSGGAWATAGKSGTKACVKRTKDAGRACTKETQCEGYCLARSQTCAPITPMFGCNDILQADGREVSLCID